jgi:hypothetical protein
MEKTAGDIVRIVIVVHEFVLTPMVGRPSQGGAFEVYLAR